MKSLTSKVRRFLTSEDGPTAVEYAVMVSLIIVVCIAGISALGTSINSMFSGVSGKITGP